MTYITCCGNIYVSITLYVTPVVTSCMAKTPPRTCFMITPCQVFLIGGHVTSNCVVQHTTTQPVHCIVHTRQLMCMSRAYVLHNMSCTGVRRAAGHSKAKHAINRLQLDQIPSATQICHIICHILRHSMLRVCAPLTATALYHSRVQITSSTRIASSLSSAYTDCSLTAQTTTS